MTTAFDVGASAAMEKVALQLRFNKEQKKRMHDERRDPRLYSNMRGMLQLESRDERKKAHKKLSPGVRDTKMEAFREGFFRRKHADMIVGPRGGGGDVVGAGLFVGGSNMTDADRAARQRYMMSALKAGGSLQRAKSLYQKKFKDDYATVAISRASGPSFGFLRPSARKAHAQRRKFKPQIHIGEPGGIEQRQFYADVIDPSRSGQYKDVPLRGVDKEWTP